MSNQTEDYVHGRVFRGKKLDGSPAAFFDVLIYETDKDENPVQIGEVVLANKKKMPKYKIRRSYRIAESSLMKVAAGESKSCNVYYRKR